MGKVHILADSLQAESRKLSHLDICMMTSRNTLSDIDYQKFEQMTQRGIIYVTNMKKNLKYSVLSDIMY